MIPEEFIIEENGDIELYVINDQGINVFRCFTFEQLEGIYLVAKSKRDQLAQTYENFDF